QPDALNGRFAAWARLPGSAIDAELILIFAAQPGAADVVANAGAAPLDGSVQHDGDGLAESVGGRCTEIASILGRMQLGLEERFVGVDVADASHHALIEQHRLEAALGRCQPVTPVA